MAVVTVSFVILAALVVGTTVRRRDVDVAIGQLSRETRRRDRGRGVKAVEERRPKPPTGREVERAATLERSRARLPMAPRASVPVPLLDAGTLGVTRRQFLNRSMINMMLLGLSGFGASMLAFLWPSSSGGFGAKIALPLSIDDIEKFIAENHAPYYYAPGRLYVNPYPASALPEAKQVSAYSASAGVLGAMEAGIVVLYQKCPHLGCRVPWCATSQWFECPCHGSQYNRVGEKKGGPAPRGVDRFPVDILGDRITVDTGLVVQGPPIGTNTTGQEAEGPHCVSR